MTQHRDNIWPLLWQMIQYAPKLYWIDTAFWLLIMGLPVIPGLIIREFFNTLTERSPENFSPVFWIILFLGIGIARIMAIFAGRITKTQHRFTMSALIRRNFLEKLLERPGADPLRTEESGERTVAVGELISFFRDDANQLEDNVVGTNEVLGAGIFAFGSVCFLLNINARITLFVFLPLALIALIIQQLGDRLKRYRRASRQATQQVTGIIGEMFATVQAIKVAGAESSVIQQLQRLGDRRRQLMLRDQLFTAILETSFDNLINIGTGAILLLAIQSLESTEALNVGDLALFIYYLAFVTNFLGFLGSFLTTSQQSEVSLERIKTLLSCKTQALVAHRPLYLQSLTGKKPALPSAQPTAQRLQKTNRASLASTSHSPLENLVVSQLTYHYPGTKQGITDVSLRLERGSLTVIIGPLGSGKTTLLQVLLGLLPKQKGEIYWNHHKIDNPAQFFLPPRSAYTPQAPRFFSTTLRENLLLGLALNDRALLDAVFLAVFEQDLARMPEGLETLVGPRGMRLSGGQLQRAAAARMLVRRPDILVFDDLSSALDIATETRLWQRLFMFPKNPEISPNLENWLPTYLVVSHRRSLLERADCILVMDQGRIVTQGRLAEIPSHWL